VRLGGATMTPDRRPLNEAVTTELVAATVREIDARGDADGETLLSGLLCAAWPTSYSQNQ